MSKDKSKEVEFDFNIDSIFGGFSTETPANKIEGLSTADDENSEELTDDIINKLTEDQEEDLVEDSDDDAKEDDSEESTEEDDGDDEEEVEDNSTEDESEDESEEVEYSYKALASYLAEQGIIDFEDSEDIEDNPEILEEAVLNTAKNLVKEYKESIPEEGKLFLDYLEQGGDPSKYLQTFEKPLDFQNLDLEDEKVQKRVVAEFLKTQDYEEDEIKEILQDYEDGLILGKQAKIASKKLEKLNSKKQEQLIAQQQAELEKRQEAVEKYIGDIKSAINSSNTLGGLEVSTADKKEFEKYLLQKDKSGQTQYEKELKENPMQTQIELAYLKFKKFNFEKLAKQVKTSETKRIRNLVKVKDKTVSGKSKQIARKKSGDLSGFKQLF